jgi:A/G-specific adenine glycosylase
LDRFPTVSELAHAEEEELLKYWQGLGYYSRARNMHATAKYIHFECNGVFPKDEKGLLALKGVGPYTAAAIGSFAYRLPLAVIDGNVERVVSRLVGIETDIRSAKGKKELSTSVYALFDAEQPDLFNQSIMELGSQICSPRSPQCEICPIREHCWAFKNQAQNRLPYKPKKTKVKDVHFHFMVIGNGSKCLIEQRQKGIWTKLYQFPLIEGEMNRSSLLQATMDYTGMTMLNPPEHNYSTTHLLSHRRIHAHFYTIHAGSPLNPSKSHIFEIDFSDLAERYPVPVLIENYLNYRGELC